MTLRKDAGNGIISLVVSVAITLWLADDEEGPWNLMDVTIAVAIAGFFSGFFTSFFAE
jgi:hypothetical protein